MKHITSSIAFLFCSLLSAVLLASCGKDYQDDIDKLNATHASIEKKVVTLETQVETINSQLQQLALLATAIENHFYLTEVITTSDGYEITLSNGRKIILQKGPQNTLVFAPAISMTQIGGFFFWTLNGTLILDGDGTPLRTSGPTPIVKYNILTQQWVISVDNGITFQDINVYASITLNQELLMQIINNFVEENKTTLFNQTMLYQIISTYIQLNYAELFDVRMLNDVIYNYVHERYTKIFSYELLEKIFNQYNFKYYTDQIDVDALVDIILSFIRENQSIFLNNEVLFEIISNYMEVNKTTIFDDKLLLEVINNFIQNNQNYINVELLTQIVFNYIDQHEEIIVNNKVVQDILIEYVQKNYTQIFQQNILVQILNNYIMMNRTDVINQTLIEEILNNYIQNHYTTLIDRTVFEQILNRYITVNETSVIDRDILIEVIANYFDRNYNLFIDRTFIQQEIQNYIDVHQLKIIDVDIIEVIVNKYIAKYYKEIFDTTILTRIIENYFVEHTTIIEEYVTKYVGATMEYSVGDLWATIIYNGESVRVPVYGKSNKLRNNVQSVVVMPDSAGHLSWLTLMGGGNIYGYSLDLKYRVTPAHMANYIRDLMWHNEVTLELVTTDGNGNISTQPIYEAEASNDGIISIHFSAQSIEDIKAVALHIKENTTNATDIMTDFTVVETEFDPRITQEIPEEYLRKMKPYMPIYSGNMPPNIEGTYLISKQVLVYDSTPNTSLKPGDVFMDGVVDFTHQDMIRNTVLFREEERYNNTVSSQSNWEEAIILGNNSNFTVFIVVNSKYNDGVTTIKAASIYSGTMTTSGVKDLYYGFVILDKNDPNGQVMSVGEFRIFKDQDGMSGSTTWMARQNNARAWANGIVNQELPRCPTAK